MDEIRDMANFVQSRQRKGKTQEQIIQDLAKYGYDRHAAIAMIIRHYAIYLPPNEDSVE